MGKFSFLNFLCDIHCGKYPLHRCVLALCTFPSSVEKKPRHFTQVGFEPTTFAIAAVSYQTSEIAQMRQFESYVFVFSCVIFFLYPTSLLQKDPLTLQSYYCPHQSWILSRPAPSHHARARVNQEYLSGFLYNSHGNS